MHEIWQMLNEGATIGATGSEDGTIILDEEHPAGARITIESVTKVAPFAITCGIYGWMVHTRYFGSESEARAQCVPMKLALEQILDSIPRTDDPSQDEKSAAVVRALGRFVEEFP